MLNLCIIIFLLIVVIIIICYIIITNINTCSNGKNNFKNKKTVDTGPSNAGQCYGQSKSVHYCPKANFDGLVGTDPTDGLAHPPIEIVNQIKDLPYPELLNWCDTNPKCIGIQSKKDQNGNMKHIPFSKPLISNGRGPCEQASSVDCKNGSMCWSNGGTYAQRETGNTACKNLDTKQPLIQQPTPSNLVNTSVYVQAPNLTQATPPQCFNGTTPINTTDPYCQQQQNLTTNMSAFKGANPDGSLNSVHYSPWIRDDENFYYYRPIINGQTNNTIPLKKMDRYRKMIAGGKKPTN